MALGQKEASGQKGVSAIRKMKMKMKMKMERARRGTRVK
jgi:hypothetical protein